MTVASDFLHVMTVEYLAICVWEMCMLDVSQLPFIKYFLWEMICACVCEREREIV